LQLLIGSDIFGLDDRISVLDNDSQLGHLVRDQLANLSLINFIAKSMQGHSIVSEVIQQAEQPISLRLQSIVLLFMNHYRVTSI